MAEVKLSAEMRTEFGKGAARRIRRADKIPAVLYGHGADPLHITLPGHETLLALREDNALLAVDVDGDSKLALPRQVQRDPIKGFIEHVDLLIVRRGEKVVVDVAIHTEGEAAPETVVVVDRNTVSVEAEATNIPHYVMVSIEGMEAGSQVLAADLDLPAGSTLNEEDDILIVNVTSAPTQAELEADLEVEGDEGAEPAEGDEEAEGDEAAEGAEGEEKSD